MSNNNRDGINYEDFPSLSRERERMRPGSIATEQGAADALEVVEIPKLEELTLESLNLKEELLTQYNRTRQMLHEASYNAEIPLNQKAQVINSASSILSQLIKSESELHSVEEVKKIESVLIEVLKTFPDLQEAFLAAYQAASEVYHVQ